jgi:hypothetical protein
MYPLGVAHRSPLCSSVDTMRSTVVFASPVASTISRIEIVGRSTVSRPRMSNAR